MPEETKWNFLNILEWGLFVTAGPLLEQSGVQQGVNVGGSPTSWAAHPPAVCLNIWKGTEFQIDWIFGAKI